MEDGQGLNQIGGTPAKSYLEQNKPNNLETVTIIGSRTYVETGPQTAPETGSPRNQAGNDCVAKDIFVPRPWKLDHCNTRGAS